MALSLTLVITFDKLTNLSNFASYKVDAKSITTTFPVFNTIQDINAYYPFIKETPGFSSGNHVLTLTGHLAGLEINENFDDIDDFNSFLLENNILPKSAQKIGYCPLF